MEIGIACGLSRKQCSTIVNMLWSLSAVFSHRQFDLLNVVSVATFFQPQFCRSFLHIVISISDEIPLEWVSYCDIAIRSILKGSMCECLNGNRMKIEIKIKKRKSKSNQKQISLELPQSIFASLYLFYLNPHWRKIAKAFTLAHRASKWERKARIYHFHAADFNLTCTITLRIRKMKSVQSSVLHSIILL